MHRNERNIQIAAQIIPDSRTIANTVPGKNNFANCPILWPILYSKLHKNWVKTS